MNLSDLMARGVSPPVIADALFPHFEITEQREIAAGGWPFQYVLICRDRHETPRLLVLFAWFGTGWHYQAHHPKHILPRLSLCDGQ